MIPKEPKRLVARHNKETNIRAWLVSWEGAEDSHLPEQKIVAILNQDLTVAQVSTIVEVLYASATYTLHELARWAEAPRKSLHLQHNMGGFMVIDSHNSILTGILIVTYISAGVLFRLGHWRGASYIAAWFASFFIAFIVRMAIQLIEPLSLQEGILVWGILMLLGMTACYIFRMRAALGIKHSEPQSTPKSE